MQFIKKNAWYFVSAYLLGVYLTYFHLLNVTAPENIGFLGAGFAVLWMASCFVFQKCFRNRFEFAIHCLITLDIHLESLALIHSGYGFYFCAVSFWGVFLLYHHWPSLSFSSTTETSQEAAVAQASI